MPLAGAATVALQLVWTKASDPAYWRVVVGAYRTCFALRASAARKT
jgi:hypothetical protein